MIRYLKKKDFTNFISFCDNQKIFYDLRTQKVVFNQCVKEKIKCFFKEDSGEISSLVMIKKVNNERYLRVFSRNVGDIEKLFQFLNWQKFDNVFIKARKGDRNFLYYNKRAEKYFVSYTLKRAGFYIEKDLGNEVLLNNKNRDNYGNNKHINKC